MAGMGRSMSRSFISSTRSVFRACKSNGEVQAGAKRNFGNSTASRPSVSSSSSFTFSQTRRPASFFFRLPGEVASLQSLLPLHSATASARMVAQLSTTAGTLLQGGEIYDNSDGWYFVKFMRTWFTLVFSLYSQLVAQSFNSWLLSSLHEFYPPGLKLMREGGLVGMHESDDEDGT